MSKDVAIASTTWKSVGVAISTFHNVLYCVDARLFTLFRALTSGRENTRTMLVHTFRSGWHVLLHNRVQRALDGFTQFRQHGHAIVPH